ncbi:MAG: membrane protein insertion efficiency factor YidD [Williamsia sp.]|nr:membrane protein insertion efficiency factor YidD [Williamsia sp.]
MIKPFVLAGMILLTHQLACAQEAKDDLALIGNRSAGGETAYYQRPGNNTRAIQTHHTSALVKYNPVTLVLKGAMAAYQHAISPQLSRHCPYEITCSNFSKQAIQEFGIVKGVFLSADRILRCNRIGVLDTDQLDFNENNGTIMDAPTKYRQ